MRFAAIFSLTVFLFLLDFVHDTDASSSSPRSDAYSESDFAGGTIRSGTVGGTYLDPISVGNLPGTEPQSTDRRGYLFCFQYLQAANLAKARGQLTLFPLSQPTLSLIS